MRGLPPPPHSHTQDTVKDWSPSECYAAVHGQKYNGVSTLTTTHTIIVSHDSKHSPYMGMSVEIVMQMHINMVAIENEYVNAS